MLLQKSFSTYLRDPTGRTLGLRGITPLPFSLWLAQVRLVPSDVLCHSLQSSCAGTIYARKHRNLERNQLQSWQLCRNRTETEMHMRSIRDVTEWHAWLALPSTTLCDSTFSEPLTIIDKNSSELGASPLAVKANTFSKFVVVVNPVDHSSSYPSKNILRFQKMDLNDDHDGHRTW